MFADGAPVAITVEGPGPVGPFFPLGRQPQPGNALYLGFKPNPNNTRPFPQKMRFLALLPPSAVSDEAQRVGRPASELVPPVDLVWEYRPRADQDVWLRLNVLADESVALTRDGYVDVDGPQTLEPSIEPSLKALVGEKRYVFGPDSLRPIDFPRHALHAYRLAFRHPDHGRPLELVAEPPADFRELISRLRLKAR